MMSLPFMYGFTNKRWQRPIDAMLEKNIKLETPVCQEKYYSLLLCVTSWPAKFSPASGNKQPLIIHQPTTTQRPTNNCRPHTMSQMTNAKV